MSAPSVMLRTVTLAGALDQFLPDPQALDISSVFSDAGTITIQYPSYGVNFNLLKDDVELAVILNGVEIPSLRCKVEQTSGNNASEDGGSGSAFVWTFTARTLMARLKEAVVYPPSWPTIVDPPQHSYVANTAGAIMVDQINAAQARGALQWLSVDFTATHDSSGAVWANTVDMIVNVGLNFYDLLLNLVAANGFEVQMHGRTLQAYNDNTLGTDRTTGSTPVIFTKGRDMKESPRKLSTRDLSTTILVAGNNNIFTERVSATPYLTQWGRREEYVALNNIGTMGQLAVFGDLLLATANTELLEITHSLYFQVDENPQPIRDFTVGDWAFSDVGNGPERHRIKQWTLSLDTSDNSDNYEGSVVLNDLVDEQLTKVEQRLSSIENGDTWAWTGGTVDLGKTPGQPSMNSLATSYYLLVNQAYTIVTATWNVLTTNSDSTTMTDLQGYNVRWQYVGDGFWRNAKSVEDGSYTVTFDSILPNRNVSFEVQAYNQWGRAGAWSTPMNITTAHDTTPPIKPSSPAVTSVVGTLRVEWDGLDYLGAVQVADFVGVQVHVSSAGGAFVPDATTQKDFLTGNAKTGTSFGTDQGLVYNTQYWVKLIAIDSSGNLSAASDTTTSSTATLLQLVTTDIGTGQVGLANTAFSDVGNVVNDGNFEIASWRATRTALISATHLVFDNTTASVGTWSLRSDLWSASPPTEDLMLQSGLPVKPGEVIFGAMDVKATSTVVGVIHLNVQWFNAAGQQLNSAGAVSATNYQLSGMEWTTLDNAWHSRVTNPSGPSVAPPNVATMNILLRCTTRSAGQAWIDAVEVRRQVDTLLIADAAITTAKIANLAVNDAKIANLSVGKITTGTLSADVVVAARIKTANTGARAEVNSSGIGLWDGSGNQTINFDATTGQATMVGQISTAPSGNRVVVNPYSGGYIPEIRWYPNSSSNYTYINSVTPVGGTSAYIGVNGDQFTANGQLSSTRMYMYETGVSLEYIREDTLAQWGAGIYLGPLQINMGITTSSNIGYLDMDNTGVSLGFNGSTAVDSDWNFNNDGTHYPHGLFNNYVSAASNGLLFTGQVSTGTSVTSCGFGYGATMLGAMGPGGTLIDSSTVRAWQCNASSSTGFGFAFASATTGTMVLWSYRG